MRQLTGSDRTLELRVDLMEEARQPAIPRKAPQHATIAGHREQAAMVDTDHDQRHHHDRPVRAKDLH